ncbi:hypothetical protein [Empedobacter brevis]|uniref:hypothetical protein n=1 Tax=Empedobacter brevis TaxID=247 RepID=UPI0033426FFC
MRRILKITVIIFLAICANSCILKKYPVSYSIYKGDKEINFPNNKIEILLMNDTTGVFKNYLNSDKAFVQKFNYNISDNAFLHISNLDTLNQNIISLSNNDTITVYKRKMLYFYNGEKKYLLYFRKR